MKQNTLLFTIIVILSGCTNDADILQKHTYNRRESGAVAISHAVRTIVLVNPYGPMIIDGSVNDSTINWFMDKTVTAESQAKDDEQFPQISLNSSTIGDTVFLQVEAPVIMVHTSGISVSVPNSLQCIVRSVRGPIMSSYLRSNFVGEQVATSTIRFHEGSCLLNGTDGDMSLQVTLPDSGTCKVSVNSGNISLRIPATTASMVSLQTLSGVISHSGLTILGPVTTATSLAGKLGTGRGTIQLFTRSGNISLVGY